MQQRIKLAKTAYVGYIYADGHAVVLHKERHEKAGEVEWAEIWEKIDTHCAFDGRIVFHHPHYDRRLRMALEAYSLRHSVPSVDKGSENTKKHDLRVGTFTIEFKDGADLHWTIMPDIIADGITYQPDCTEVFNPEWDNGYSRWGDCRIAKVHRLPKQVQAETVAA